MGISLQLATGHGITSLQGSEQKSRCFSDFSNRLSVLYVLFHDSDHVIREFPILLLFCINDRMHHHTCGVRVNSFFFV